MAWSQTLTRLQDRFHFKTQPPLLQAEIEAEAEKLGLPQHFIDFYCLTNGLASAWFRVLPLRDDANIKATWDSLQKANDAGESKFSVDEKFLERFVVIAELDGGACAVFDKTDGSIWYEEDDQFSRTDLSFEDFVETCLREVAEL